jgi:hypothetical protein
MVKSVLPVCNGESFVVAFGGNHHFRALWFKCVGLFGFSASTSFATGKADYGLFYVVFKRFIAINIQM